MIKKILRFVKDNKLLFPIILLSGFISALILFYINYGTELYSVILNKENLKEWLNGFGVWGKVIFVLIRALQTIVKFIPSEPLEIASGYVFGTFGGCLLCLLGTEIGSIIIILLTKYIGARFINAILTEKQILTAKKYINKINVNTSLFLLYLIPGTPKDLLTYFQFMLPVSTPKFIFLTTVARIPSIITSTWCGAEIGNSNYLYSIIIFVATGILGIGSTAIYTRYLKNKEKKS